MPRKRDFFHTGLDVSRSECQASRLKNPDVYGDTYHVAKDGKDGDDGSLNYPFLTVQKAIDTQIITNSGKGDKIVVFPGDYAEALTGDLTGVRLTSAMPLNPDAVRIKPVAGGAYAGTLSNAIIDGITFYSGSGTLTTYAAFRALKMYGSVIDGCVFRAGASIADSTAFRIGQEAGSNEYDRMLKSRFTNNLIATGSSGKNFYWGIVFGISATTDVNNRYTYMKNSVIGWNDIAAEDYGIMMGVIYTTGSNGIIRNNNVHGGLLLNGQCAYMGIRAYDRGHDNKLLKVYWNNISAQADCIFGFDVQNVMGNIVGTGSGEGTPVDEVMCN